MREHRNELTAPDLVELLRDSARVSLFAVTLGIDVDQLIKKRLEQDEYAAAAIADAVGSAGAEQAIEQLQTSLQQDTTTEGFGLTERFSPGYGTVPLQLQTDIISLLAGERIGISVTASLLLSPRKSITAIAGWHQTACDGPAIPNKCQRCALSYCHFRRLSAAQSVPSDSRRARIAFIEFATPSVASEGR